MVRHYVQIRPFIHQPERRFSFMARLPKDVVVISAPVRTFPNGDYFYIELSRQNGQYDCWLKMARDGNPAKSVTVVRAKGKTIREAEQNCYNKALDRCLRLCKYDWIESRALSPIGISRSFFPFPETFAMFPIRSTWSIFNPTNSGTMTMSLL